MGNEQVERVLRRLREKDDRKVAQAMRKDGDYTLPKAEIDPLINPLIDTFRDKLAASEEYRQALVEAHLYSHRINRDDITFNKGLFDYSVYYSFEDTDLMKLPEGERHSAAMHYLGYRLLRVTRGGTKPGAPYEYIELATFIHENPPNKQNHILYNNYTQRTLERVNTTLALSRAQDIVTNF